MKAAYLREWNHLSVCQVDDPVPQRGEALLKVLYGGICGSDITVYRGLHMTAKAPVVLCHEILGVVESLPEDYRGDIKIGEQVLVNPVMECGVCAACRSGLGNVCESLKLLGIHENGGFAEYVKVRADRMVPVSGEIPVEISALSEPFAVAYHVTEQAGVKQKDRVLIIGAGTIGLVVALTAREKNVKEVIIAEINPQRRKIAEKLGFQTIDTAEKDIREAVLENTGQVGYDVVIDASGAKAIIAVLPDLCRSGGRILELSLSGANFEFPIGKISFKEQKLLGSRLYSHDHFEAGVKMLAALAKKYPLEILVADIIPLDETMKGIEKMMNGQACGKILVKCNE